MRLCGSELTWIGPGDGGPRQEWGLVDVSVPALWSVAAILAVRHGASEFDWNALIHVSRRHSWPYNPWGRYVGHGQGRHLNDTSILAPVSKSKHSRVLINYSLYMASVCPCVWAALTTSRPASRRLFLVRRLTDPPPLFPTTADCLIAKERGGRLAFPRLLFCEKLKMVRDYARWNRAVAVGDSKGWGAEGVT